MQPKSIGNYGGPYQNYRATEEPETEQDADFANREFEDTAQMTQTIERVSMHFTTVSGGAPPFTIPTGNISHATVWGRGAATRPTITKTATGRYTVTFAASYVDGLGETENVAFLRGLASFRSSDVADDIEVRILTVAANVVTVSTKAGGVLADVGDNSAAPFEVVLVLYA
jgi:hypothetical protein